MGVTYIAGAVGYSETYASSLACSSALNIAAGDVLVCFASWEVGSGGTLSCDDGGANSFTMEAESGDLDFNYCVFGCVLNASANGSATVTFHNSTSRTYRSLAVMQFRPVAGSTVSKDAADTAGGTGASETSPAIVTTGTDEMVVCGNKCWIAPTLTAAQIGGINALAQLDASAFTSVWCRILTAIESSLVGSGTGGASTWRCGIFSLKAASDQFARPVSDVSVGGWTASSGTDRFAMVDEEAASDADYITSGATPSNDECVLALGAISTPAAGTVTLRVRMKYV